MWPYGNRSTTTHHGATLVCRSIERNRRGPPSTRPRAHCGQEFGSESHVVTDNERLQSEAGREHAQTDELSCTTTSGIGREAGSDGQPPDKNKASDSAAEPAVTISAAELRERKELMFDAAQSEPRASGRKSAAPAASRGVVQTAWELMEALSTETVKSLSAAFGNFDRVVGAGWLLADAVLGPPLLERSKAHAIGLKARRDAGKLKEDVARARKAPLAAARKLDDTDPQRQLLVDEADRKEADLREAPLALPFHEAGQAEQVRSSATGSRKRAREAPEPIVTPLQRRTEEAEAECIRTMKALDAAQRIADTAEKKYQAKGRVFDKWLKLQSESRRYNEKRMKCYNAAEDAYLAAQTASQDADTDVSIACMEALLAENELLRCEKASSDALVSELMAA